MKIRRDSEPMLSLWGDMASTGHGAGPPAAGVVRPRLHNAATHARMLRAPRGCRHQERRVPVWSAGRAPATWRLRLRRVLRVLRQECYCARQGAGVERAVSN